MVNVFKTPGSTSRNWNVDARVGPGSAGDDVRLVQYLLVRAPEAEPYLTTPVNGGPGIGINDVDGIWGPQTSAAMSWLEQTFNVISDGVVDPCPPGTDFFSSQINNCFYKIILLQQLYVINQVRGNNSGTSNDTKTTVLMTMQDDGMCPSALVQALNNALANSSSTS
jgi:hypothetical protein